MAWTPVTMIPDTMAAATLSMPVTYTTYSMPGLDDRQSCQCQYCNPEAYDRLNDERARAEAAKIKAEALLRSLVSDVEWEGFRQDGYLTIISQLGHIYRIRNRYAGNIDRLDKRGRRIVTLCCYPRSVDQYNRIPVADSVAAQLLALRFNEEEFLKIAEVA